MDYQPVRLECALSYMDGLLSGSIDEWQRKGCTLTPGITSGKTTTCTRQGLDCHSLVSSNFKQISWSTWQQLSQNQLAVKTALKLFASVVSDFPPTFVWCILLTIVNWSCRRDIPGPVDAFAFHIKQCSCFRLWFVPKNKERTLASMTWAAASVWPLSKKSHPKL